MYISFKKDHLAFVLISYTLRIYTVLHSIFIQVMEKIAILVDKMLKEKKVRDDINPTSQKTKCLLQTFGIIYM